MPPHKILIMAKVTVKLNRPLWNRKKGDTVEVNEEQLEFIKMRKAGEIVKGKPSTKTEEDK